MSGTASNFVTFVDNIIPMISGLPSTATFTEDTKDEIDLSSVLFADADGDDLTVTLTASAGVFDTPADGAAGGVTETLVSSTVVTLAGSPAAINSYLDTTANLQYTPAADVSGTAVFELGTDTDLAEGSVTLAMVAGEAAFDGTRMTYTASIETDETFYLRAAATGYTAVRSVEMSASPPPPPRDDTIRDKVDGTGKTTTDPEIEEGGELSGGEVCGTALSKGVIRDVTLCPRTSYLELVNETPEFSGTGSRLEQAVTGEVKMEFPTSQSRMLPVGMRKTEDGAQGFYYDDDGNLSIRMGINLEIIMYPMFTDEAAVRAAKDDYDPRFSLSFDEASNFVFTRDTKQGLEATQPRYVGRPGISAFRAVRSRKLGFHFYPSPWLANVEQVSFISENAAGEIMEQEMVPVPRDWFALKQRLQDEPGVSFARISSAGVISVGYYGRTVQLLTAYEVDPNKATANDNRDIVFVEAGDLNDDGELDYYSYYPNGDRQVIYVFP
jgi:hypothetical protein